jgi:uncharacterized protein (DUF58 family)
MTRRGAGLVLAAAVLAVWGWRAGWPELIALGAASLVVVLACLALVGRRPRVSMVVDQAALRVVRGQPAAVTVTLDVRGRRGWSRLVEGAVDTPGQTLRLPRPGAGGPVMMRVPLDTSTRGQQRAGPYTVLHGDPLGVVQRQAGRAEGGVVTVQPRVHQVRRSLTTTFNEGSSENAGRRSGDQHFHALREYVLGDEPRTVHWRSSARAGKLVVRQQVAAASTGTTIVLDVDSSSYPSSGAFAAGWDRERFELAVEVAASLAAAQAGSTDQVHFMTTARGATVVSAPSGAVHGLLDVLSVVQGLPPLETAPEEVPAVVRRTRAAHVIVVTGTPGQRAVQAVQTAGQSTSLTVLAVGTGEPLVVRGARVLPVRSAEELMAL